MKLIKLTLLASVTVILAGCDTVQTTQAPPVDHTRLMAVNDNLIVPGQRIGPVFLGMTEAELYSKLGNPTNTTYGNDGTWIWYRYNNQGLLVTVSTATHSVNIIQTGSPSYATAGGCKVGSSPLEMKATLGEHDGPADYLHKYVYNGIAVSFDYNGNVAGFQVSYFDPNGRYF